MMSDEAIAAYNQRKKFRSEYSAKLHELLDGLFEIIEELRAENAELRKWLGNMCEDFDRRRRRR